jgi:hypothetical protein
VHPLTVGPASPRGSASAPEKYESNEFAKLIFSGHTGLSGVHQTFTVHCSVHCQSNGYLSELAVGADVGAQLAHQWRTGLSGAPMRRELQQQLVWCSGLFIPPPPGSFSVLLPHSSAFIARALQAPQNLVR